jgi:hypothetical protein
MTRLAALALAPHSQAARDRIRFAPPAVLLSSRMSHARAGALGPTGHDARGAT